MKQRAINIPGRNFDSTASSGEGLKSHFWSQAIVIGPKYLLTVNWFINMGDGLLLPPWIWEAGPQAHEGEQPFHLCPILAVQKAVLSIRQAGVFTFAPTELPNFTTRILHSIIIPGGPKPARQTKSTPSEANPRPQVPREWPNIHEEYPNVD